MDVVFAVGGVILGGICACLEILMLFSNGVQFIPLVGSLLSLGGIVLTMTVIKLKKPEQNTIVETICLTAIFGIFEAKFFTQEVYYKEEYLFYATVLSQPLKCFIGWLVSIMVEYNLRNRVDKLCSKIQECYVNQVDGLKKCKELISTAAQKQKEAEELVRLFEAIGYAELRKNFQSKSESKNDEIMRKLKATLGSSSLNFIQDGMMLQEIDENLDKNLKATEDMRDIYRSSQYTIQDYKKLKEIYKSLQKKKYAEW